MTAPPRDALARLGGVLVSTAFLLPLALVAVLLVQIPTFDYFFYNDDYVPFAEIAESGSTWDYVRDLVFAQDITPNWRVVPGLFYLGGYRIFGMEPLPYHFVSVGFHLGTSALLFHILRRTTGKAWAGFLGAILFGINPTHVFTVAQITSLNNVLGAFFAVATLAALIESLRSPAPLSTEWRGVGGEAPGGAGFGAPPPSASPATSADRPPPTSDLRRPFPLFYAAALASFVLAIASNESMAGLFPAFALALLLLDDAPLRERILRAALRSLPFAAIGGGALLAFFACDCNEASTSFFGGGNAENIFFIYLGRIVYPVGLEPPTHVGDAHRAAAIALLALVAVVAVRGPTIARVGAAFLLLATIPYTWVWVFTAQRYTYQAAAGFALLVPAVLADLHARFPRAAQVALGAAAAPLVAALIAWYAWQTLEQGEPFKRQTDDWEMLVTDVREVFPEVPPGSRVIVIGGPWTDTIYQFHVMPSIAHVTWNTRVRMYTVPAGSEGAREAIEDRQPTWLVARYEGDTLVPVSP